jgi:hypothetical protein
MIEDMKTDSREYEEYEAAMRVPRSQEGDTFLRYPTPSTEGSATSENGEEGESDVTMSEDDTENADMAS